MIKNVTYWGNKAEVMLAIKGAPIVFAYGQTRAINIPDDVKLSAHFVIEDVPQTPKKTVEAKVVLNNRKKGVK